MQEEYNFRQPDPAHFTDSDYKQIYYLYLYFYNSQKLTYNKAMPNWNFVKRQLKFDKPRYLFTKTQKPKPKTHLFYDKTNALNIYLIGKNIIII